MEDGPESNDYYVKWKGLPYEDCTWERWSVVQPHPEILASYHKRLESFKFPRGYIGYVPWFFLVKLTVCRERDSTHKLSRAAFRKLEPENSPWLNGELRDYQVDGVNWLVYSWCNYSNGILADEMGLGKTIQTLSFCGWLQFSQNIHGPFLIVVPLSTLGNWESECQKWVPGANLVVYTGSCICQLHSYGLFETLWTTCQSCFIPNFVNYSTITS